jgi:hypothetical protein
VLPVVEGAPAAAQVASVLTARAGADRVVTEGALVTLDGSTSVGPGGGLSYSWQVVGAAGPPITLASATSATPSFRGFDDGVYRFRLTVREGGAEATDDVEVRVANQAPVVSAAAEPTGG